MKRAEEKNIRKAVQDTIAKVKNGLLSIGNLSDAIASGSSGDTLRDLVSAVTRAHEDASTSAGSLSAAILASDNKSFSETMRGIASKVDGAKDGANQLGATPSGAQLSALREADNQALTELSDLESSLDAFGGSAHRGEGLWNWLSSLDPSQSLGLAAGAAIFLLATIGLVVLGYGIVTTDHLIDHLADPRYARGLISYILAIGTIAVALILVVAAVTGGENGKDTFDRGKQILTVLIGVFGTILGFYYGQSLGGSANAAQTGQAQSPAAQQSATPVAGISPVATAPSISTTPTAGPITTPLPSATP